MALTAPDPPSIYKIQTEIRWSLKERRRVKRVDTSICSS
jgi:hypothetical protein